MCKCNIDGGKKGGKVVNVCKQKGGCFGKRRIACDCGVKTGKECVRSYK